MQPTNPNQFTEKAWEAIAHTPDVAKQYQQQQLESEHLCGQTVSATAVRK
ncbi:MAG: hypothetical protein RLZZ184_3934 [Cyanobacteriota bacterium]